jgi:hypothetical protein
MLRGPGSLHPGLWADAADEGTPFEALESLEVCLGYHPRNSKKRMGGSSLKSHGLPMPISLTNFLKNSVSPMAHLVTCSWSM